MCNFQKMKDTKAYNWQNAHNNEIPKTTPLKLFLQATYCRNYLSDILSKKESSFKWHHHLSIHAPSPTFSFYFRQFFLSHYPLGYLPSLYSAGVSHKGTVGRSQTALGCNGSTTRKKQKRSARDKRPIPSWFGSISRRKKDVASAIISGNCSWMLPSQYRWPEAGPLINSERHLAGIITSSAEKVVLYDRRPYNCLGIGNWTCLLVFIGRNCSN